MGSTVDAISDRSVVIVYREEVEVLGLEHLVLLREDEDDAPQVTDQPSVNRLVATIGRHEDVGDFGQQALERELFQVGGQRILVNIDDLVGLAGIVLNLLVPVAHCLIVGVLNAAFDVTEQQGLPPANEPLARWVSRLHNLLLLRHRFLLYST